MQGGEIGVASEANLGSTFQFYVKTRRTEQLTSSLEKPDFQLLVREDALREACGTEILSVGKVPSACLASSRASCPVPKSSTDLTIATK